MGDEIEMKTIRREIDEIEVLSDKEKETEKLDETPNRRWKSINFRSILHRRYFIMAIVILVNFCNTLCWISYSPVANYVNAYYGEQRAVWLSGMYISISIPASFASMWIGSYSQVRSILLFATIPMFIGSLIRLISTVPNLDYRFHVAIAGQVISALSYPFIMFLPSKVSDKFFPASERTLATSFGVLSNPVAVMFANLFVPMIVQSSRQVYILNLSLFLFCTCISAVVVYIVSRSLPEEDGCFTSEPKLMLYDKSLRRCFSTPAWILIFLALGGGIGMFNCLYSMMSSLMCTAGHRNNLSGACAVLMIGSGLLGATIAGFLVDKYKWHKHVLMVTIAGSAVFGVFFIWLTKVPGWQGNSSLLICAFFLGFFGLAAYPVGLEAAVECSYPAATEVSTGYIILVGQLFSIVFIFILKSFATPLSFEDIRFGVEVCRTNATDAINIPQDYSVGILIVTVFAALLGGIGLFINPKLRRTLYEPKKPEKQEEPEVDPKKVTFLDTYANAVGVTFDD
ncbi:unnamed protein product [Caenorhabditis brenneri]